MRIKHGRLTLELHELAKQGLEPSVQRDPSRLDRYTVPLQASTQEKPVQNRQRPGQREGSALLLLHALYGSSGDWGAVAAAWSGPVYALDFAGHGKSDWVVGGVYYPENLAADIDVALQCIGAAAIAGAGLGAYLGLLVAGARPDLVCAALLLPGAGLDGGGALPDFDAPFPDLDHPPPAAHGADPMVRLLDAYVRPVEYVVPFARAARRVLLVEDGAPRPPWWEAVRCGPTAEGVQGDLGHALPRLLD